MRCDAVIAATEDRVAAVQAPDRGAPAARVPLVARRDAVAEVAAADTLAEVAADRRHVAQLLRRAEQERLRDGGVAGGDRGVARDRAHARERPDPQAAARQL